MLSVDIYAFLCYHLISLFFGKLGVKKSIDSGDVLKQFPIQIIQILSEPILSAK